MGASAPLGPLSAAAAAAAAAGQCPGNQANYSSMSSDGAASCCYPSLLQYCSQNLSLPLADPTQDPPISIASSARSPEPTWQQGDLAGCLSPPAQHFLWILLASLALLLWLWRGGRGVLTQHLTLLRPRGGAHKPWEVPVLGALPSYLWHYGCLYDHVTALLERCPTMTYSSFIPGQREIVTACPKNMQHVLKDNFQNYPKGPRFQETFEDLLGHGIFNSDGDTWRLQRKTASLAFSTACLRDSMLGTIQEEVTGRLMPLLDEAARTGQPLDMQDVLLRYTFDNICRIGFGTDPGCLEPHLPDILFARAFDQATQVTMLRNLVPPALWRLMRLLRIGPERRLHLAVQEIKSFVHSTVATKQQEQKDNGSSRGSHGPSDPTAGGGLPCNDGSAFGQQPKDILSLMMSAEGRFGDVPKEFLIDACTNFVLAGRDTSAIALTWLFWRLSQSPDVEQKILEEILSIQRKRAPGDAGPFSFSELRSLEYTQAAINETLRLHPSVPVGCKYAVDEDTFPDGTAVRKGSRVLYLMYSTGRMQQVWGPDALEFKPERWLDPVDGRLKAESQFKFPAFNAGPRLCLGKDLAYMQMKSVIAAVLPNFVMRITGNSVRTYQVSLTLFMKGGLHMNVFKRHSQEEAFRRTS